MKKTNAFRKNSLVIASLLFVGAPTAVFATLMSGCVTVNVSFPESTVQRATDDYVRDLYRAKSRKSGSASEQPESSRQGARSWFSAASEWLIPSAHAVEEVETFRVDTPKALKIKERLASRLDEVIAQKQAGVLGETNNGMLAIQGKDKVKPLLLKKVEKLVADENADRSELYAEILSANGMQKSRLINIQKSFARSFQKESPAGTWIQDGDGKWEQKK